MRRILTVCAMAWLVVPADAGACSAFSADSEMGRVVGKNFDWHTGNGWVAVNRRGIRRRPLFSSPADDDSWIAAFGSVTFSPIGPGFPISGMNEKGLVVEGLQHTDWRGDSTRIDGLTALEWAQQVLDRFDTIDEVLRFAEATPFIQFALPIHFLVCDTGGKCLVAEAKDEGLTITAGKSLRTPVLANRSWNRDFRASRPKKKKKSWLGGVAAWFSGDQSNEASSRFGTLRKALSRRHFRRDEDLFDLLDASRIRSLTKWQIIWHQSRHTVTWRHFEGNRRSRLRRIAFDALGFGCAKGAVLVTETTPDGEVRFTPCGADCGDIIRQRTERILGYLGFPVSDAFITRLLTVTAAGGCSIR